MEEGGLVADAYFDAYVPCVIHGQRYVDAYLKAKGC